MIGRLPGVTAVQYTGTVSSANAYRSPLIPSTDTSALTVDASSLGLPAVAGPSIALGPLRRGLDLLPALARGRMSPTEALWTV